VCATCSADAPLMILDLLTLKTVIAVQRGFSER
jgi:hypothetical protein